jgi:division protein CdvB (Snf7/Vps24/ESCRT-III family)
MNTKQAQLILTDAQLLDLIERLEVASSDLHEVSQALLVMPASQDVAERLQRAAMVLTRDAAQCACSLNASAKG